jgi:hypothetical protein
VSAEHKWSAGDPVVILPDENRMGGGYARVMSVGRRWMLVVGEHGGRPRKFDVESRQEKGDGIGGYCHALTPSEHEMYLRRKAAVDQARLIAGYSWWQLVNTDDLEVIVKMIADAKERAASNPPTGMRRHWT